MLTDRRETLRPSEYPELLSYRDAIRHAYWLHTEFNLTEDVQDYHTVSAAERQAVERSLLAIAQVEVAVKTFWGDVYKRFPKPEVGAVGYTFAESEVRHQDAYAHLLELLGLQDKFATLSAVPAIKSRLDLLSKHLRGGDEASERDYIFTLLLFSVFVEHVSLFSQFLIIKSFNKTQNVFKGIANIVEATSKEEQIHAQFGYKLVDIVRSEKPELFDADFETGLRSACEQAFEAESAILDWIFKAGELEFLPKAHITAFIQQRFNDALTRVGGAPLWQPDKAVLAQTLWFEEELLASKHVDFFHKRPTTYTKKTKSITADDLFAA